MLSLVEVVNRSYSMVFFLVIETLIVFFTDGISLSVDVNVHEGERSHRFLLVCPSCARGISKTRSTSIDRCMRRVLECMRAMEAVSFMRREGFI